jgi:hypothetical protein
MRKGQAAMEFLMTYGWAILVVLAAIGALAYFGVLNVKSYLPEQCFGPAGLDCLDKPSADAAKKTITFAFKNNLGNSINFTNAGNSSGDCGTDAEHGVFITDSEGNKVNIKNVGEDIKIENEEIAIATFNCTAADELEPKIAAELWLQYVSLKTGVSKKASFSIKASAS